jgi:DNA-binding response OmpR family regulator
MNSENRFFSSEEIFEKIYGKKGTSRTIDTFIFFLREKGIPLIGVRGQGYSLDWRKIEKGGKNGNAK